MEDEASTKFTKGQFDVDEFLNEATETKDLHSILKSLITWKTKNSDMMSTVLKEQTDAVISIAEEVQGLYQKIESLQCPISQLWEEIKSLKIRVDEMVDKFHLHSTYNDYVHTVMHNMLTLRAYKIVVTQTEQLVEKYYSTSNKDCEELERIAYKYAFHNQTMALMCILPNEMDVEKPIHAALKEKLLLEFSQKNIGALRRIIHVYVLLQKLDHLTKIIRDDIMMPLLKPILNEENLHQCQGDLAKVYEAAMNVLTEQLQVYIATNLFNEVRGFNVVLDCYWPVIDNLLQENLVSITAAGHADIFFDHFQKTCNFLRAIGKLCGNENLLNENVSFINHMKRFNLLVYYEIRHQEVSSSLESVILQNQTFNDNFFSTALNDPKVMQLKLQISVCFYMQIIYLFHYKIFLPVLSDQFLKSSLLLTSRYMRWIDDMLEQNKKNNSDLEKHILLCFLCDIASIKSKIGLKINNDAHLDTCVFSVVDESSKPFVQEVISINCIKLSNHFNKVKQILITIIRNEAMNKLLSVMAIPRLYRRTNKNVATEHSTYVDEAVLPIKNLHKYFEPTQLSHNHLAILDEIIATVGDGYLTLVKEVLLSVCKTEKSLRRLKNRNAPVSDESKLDSNSDEYKIRLQIKLDVSHFANELNNYTLSTGDRSLKILLQEASN